MGGLRAPCAAVLQSVHGWKCLNSCAVVVLQCAAYRPPVVLWGKPGCAAEVWALLLLVSSVMLQGVRCCCTQQQLLLQCGRLTGRQARPHRGWND